MADTSDGGVNLGAAQNGRVWDPPGDEEDAQFSPSAESKLKEKLKKVKAPTPSAPKKTPPPTDGPR